LLLVDSTSNRAAPEATVTEPHTSAHQEGDPPTSADSPPQTPTDSLSAERQQLDRLQEQLNRLQRTVRLAIEQTLAQWSGKSFGSLDANRAMATTIHDVLEGHGLRVRCPECGHAAILRCGARPGLPDGVFVFDHVIAGRRTFHGGGTTLPDLRLTAKPPRRRRDKTPPPEA